MAAYDPLDLDSAEGYLAEALRLYQVGRLSETAAPLAEALYRDPGLAADPAARLMAGKVLALDADSAVVALIDAARHRQALRRPPPRTQWSPHRRGRTLPQIALLLFIFAFAVAVFLGSGSFEYYRLALESGRWRDSLRTAGPVEYYALIPEGERPITGWPALVALHSYGASADALLPYFADRAREAGVLLIVPNFGEFPYPYSDYTTPAINAMLNEILAQQPADPRGVVLFGFVTGGEVAMLYAREYFGVAGVVAVSPLQLVEPPAGDTTLRYLLLYNAGDTVLPYNETLIEGYRAAGSAVELIILAGNADALEAEAVDMTLQFVREIYAGQ